MIENEKFYPKYIPIIIALLGFGLYAVNIGDYFRSDDFVSIAGVDSSPIAFFTGENLAGSTFYRPLTLLTFWIDKTIWGLSPIGYHLTNLLFFAIILFLFYKLLAAIFIDEKIAVFASLILAIHPAHAENAAWISGRTELVCTLFALAAMLALARFRALGKGAYIWYALSLLFAMLSMLGKENAIMLPLLLVMVDIFFQKDSQRTASPYRHIPYFVILLIYMAVRTSILEGIGGYGTTHFQVGLFIVRNFFRYIQFFFAPLDLANHAAFFIRHQLQFLGFFSVLLGVLAFLLRKSFRQKPFYFGLAVFIITFIPICNLFPQNRHALTMYLGLSTLTASLFAPIFAKDKSRKILGITFIFLWVVLLFGFSTRASLVARTASGISKAVVTQSRELLADVKGPVRLIALTVPDTYKGTFVLRNGLHHAMVLAYPDRQVISHWLSLVGIHETDARGLQIITYSTVKHEIHLPSDNPGYILLPDANWSRHLGDTEIIGPVGYRITDEDHRFRVNGIELIIDEDFINAPGTVIAAFIDGKMTDSWLEEK